MIKVENLKKSYGAGAGRTEVLKGVSFVVEKGDFLVILGASGSGKSTLLNVISGLEQADSGSISYEGKEISVLNDKELTRFRRREVGFIFQQYFLLPNLNVDKNIKMGADLAGNKDYREMLNAMGLSEKRDRYPHELSGGEQQRVAVARALAKKPNVLFLDEPTGALDENTGRQVLDHIVKQQKELGFTMVMVTHNTNIAHMADRVIRMNSGQIVEQYENAAPKGAYEIAW